VRAQRLRAQRAVLALRRDCSSACWIVSSTLSIESGFSMKS
jgi:hypothetical protein